MISTISSFVIAILGVILPFHFFDLPKRKRVKIVAVTLFLIYALITWVTTKDRWPSVDEASAITTTGLYTLELVIWWVISIAIFYFQSNERT